MPRAGCAPSTGLGKPDKLRQLDKAHIGANLSSGKLRRVMPAWHGAPMPVHALTETRLLPAKTQCFIDFLRERFNAAVSNKGDDQ